MRILSKNVNRKIIIDVDDSVYYQCSKCGVFKPKICFGFHIRGFDKLRSQCKSCYHTWEKQEVTNKWFKNNYCREKRTAELKEWRGNNREKARSLSRRSQAYRRKIVKHRISHAMSANINYSIKNKNNGHWEKIVGYSLKDLMGHLEKQFDENMNWNNYGHGKHKWSIDHIIPVAVFNFEKLENIDFKRCWALKNLRPLWFVDNSSKGKKIEKPFQPSFAF